MTKKVSVGQDNSKARSERFLKLSSLVSFFLYAHREWSKHMSRIKAGKYNEKPGVQASKANVRAKWQRMASELAKESDEKYSKAQRDLQQVRGQVKNKLKSS